MNGKDLWSLVFRNLKAGKKNARKIIFGVGCAFTLVFCFAAVVWFYKDYKNEFERNYKNDCYYYKTVDSAFPLNEIDSLIDTAEAMRTDFGSVESVLLLDIGLAEDPEVLCADEFALILDETAYSVKSYFRYQREYYQDIGSAWSQITLGFYREGMNVFPECIYSGEDAVHYIGELPLHQGEIMLDDYLLEVYGIETEPEELIGTEICLVKQGEDEQRVICENYKISGILQSEEITKRENKSPHDYHLEHIYINLKAEDEARFYVWYGTNRFYFSDYDAFLTSYNYSKELLELNLDAVDYEEMEYYVTEKGAEICILSWIMQHIGKLLLILAGIVVLIILFSLFYIIRFYHRRNLNYLHMLSYIGMEKKDRRRLYDLEMLVMILAAMLFALYVSFIFLMIFHYITNQLLCYGFTINIRAMIATLLCCFLVMWGYKSIVIIK